MNKFLLKTWIYPFYKTYAGFLFVLFLLAAGILKGEEHVAIAQFFTSDIKNLVYPYLGFILYEMLTIRFSIPWISDFRNRILQNLLYVPLKSRIGHLTFVFIYLHIPVLLYSFFMSSIALVSGQFIITATIIILAIVRIFAYSLLLNSYVAKPMEKKYHQLIQLNIPENLYFPLIVFSLRYFISKRFLSFLLSKGLSIGLLLICILLIETVDNYNRFSSVVIPIIFISNAFISYELFKFLNSDLVVFRNLPTKLGVTLFQIFTIIFILCLPEIVIMYRNFSDIISVGSLTIHILNGLMILLFLFAYPLYYNCDLEKYIIRLFWGSIILVLILLFDFPSILLCVVFCVSSIYLYTRGYYTFENVYKQIK